MEFDLSAVEMSKSDFRRGVILPKRLTKELAEFMGIVMGDGYIRCKNVINKKSHRILQSDLKISGNLKEIEYHRHIIQLFSRLFNIIPYYKRAKGSNEVIVQVHSKGIVEFCNKICGLPANKKHDIASIPSIIKQSSEEMRIAFLRGLADTDFTLTFRNRIGKGHIYPIIKAGFKSKKLVEDLEEAFSRLGLRYCTYYNDKREDKRFGPVIMHNIYLNGEKNLRKWLRIIGFSNSKFHRKIKKWQEDGFCPPGY